MEPAVARETQMAIRDEMDFLGRFLSEKTTKTENVNEYVSNRELFSVFTMWAETTKEGRGWKDKRFAKECRLRGLDTRATNINGKTTRAWQGIKLVGYQLSSTMMHEE